MNTTSKLAYENKKPTIPRDQDLILSVLKTDKGSTYKEIGYMVYKKLLLDNDTKLSAFAWKYDPVKVARRLKEMVKDDKIKVLEVRKCTRANSLCNSYIKL